MEEVISRFDDAEYARQRCTTNLLHIYSLAQSTGLIDRFVIFGSYVTAKADPNDVDVILVMDEAFHMDEMPPGVRELFDHSVAQTWFGASVFWVKPSATLGTAIDEFIGHWQIKRDDTIRGIVEVIE
jgi:hypothetical protein